MQELGWMVGVGGWWMAERMWMPCDCYFEIRQGINHSKNLGIILQCIYKWISYLSYQYLILLDEGNIHKISTYAASLLCHLSTSWAVVPHTAGRCLLLCCIQSQGSVQRFVPPHTRSVLGPQVDQVSLVEGNTQSVVLQKYLWTVLNMLDEHASICTITTEWTQKVKIFKKPHCCSLAIKPVTTKHLPESLSSCYRDYTLTYDK